MYDLKGISKVFYNRSKALTYSCISSIGIAILLIISLLNLTINVENSYKRTIKKEYGNVDLIATYVDYRSISGSIINDLNTIDGIKEISVGYFDSSFMIDDYHVYLVGSDNSRMMMDRYRYQIQLHKNEIIINTAYSDITGCNIGDTITIWGRNFSIVDIIEDEQGIATTINMALLNLEQMKELLRQEDISNFLLLQLQDGYEMDTVIEKILRIDGRLDLNIVEQDKDFYKAIYSFSIFIKALSIAIVIATGMFVACSIRRFMYKYRHDMAILRAMGGSNKQIKDIFRHLILRINLEGCFMGLLFSLIFHKLILTFINKRIQMIDGNIGFYIGKSLATTIILFVVLSILMMIGMRRCFHILPLEAFQENQLQKIGKKKNHRKAIRYPWVYYLLGKDTYITIKTMMSRLKENMLLMGTIGVIVILSFIGSGLANIIETNNNEYLKNEYRTELVVTSRKNVHYDSITDSYHRLKNVDGINTSILLSAGNRAMYQDQELYYCIVDSASMEEQGILKEGLNPGEIILSKEISDRYGITIGDEVGIISPTLYQRDDRGFIQGVLDQGDAVNLQVVDLWSQGELNGADLWMDLHNDDFWLEPVFVNKIYVSGDVLKAEPILMQLKESNMGISWSTYSESRELSNKHMKNRFLMFEAVVVILTIVAGIGWVNAMKYYIESGTQGYQIIRRNGMTISRLRNMLINHLLMYLFIGVLGGIVGGCLVLYLLTYIVEGSGIIIFEYETLVLVVFLLVVMNLSILPTIVRVSKMKLNDNSLG